MSQIFNYSGEEDFYQGGSVYSNPKEAGLFLSLGHHVDVYFPCKRARVNAPYVISGESLEKNKQVSIDVLPDECLFEILRRLPKGQERSVSACVSKRWLMLLSSMQKDEVQKDQNVSEMKPGSEDPETESDGFLTRSIEGKKATDVRLAAIAVGTASCGGLGKLVIKGGSSGCGVTNLGLRAVARCCPSLRVLSLWNVPSIGVEGLVEIANGCHQLEKLDLFHCPLVTDRALVHIARNCPNLSSFTIESCLGVGNQGLQAIGQLCPKLHSVTIKNCPLVGDQGIAGLLSSASHVITKLKLQGLNITDLSLAVVGHYGKAVTDLVLANLQNVNERGFWVMGNGHGLQKLRSLAITSCRGVTDIGLEAVGKGCPNMKQFSLKKCATLSDNGLVSFAKAAMSLESLLLEECHRITQTGFFGLLLSCGPKLKALSLSTCVGFKDMVLGLPLRLSLSTTALRFLSVCNCPGFGDVTLAILAKMCPQLRHVDLNGLHGLTDAGVLSLVESAEAGAGLVKVNLSNCINLTDNVVVALSKLHGGTLELLNLDGCGKVTDASLVAIADDCLLLNDLDVSKCAITDFGIASLARSKQLHLQIISLSGCEMLSDKSLPFLVKLGQSLIGLNLQHCNAISTQIVDILMNRLWRCDILS